MLVLAERSSAQLAAELQPSRPGLTDPDTGLPTRAGFLDMAGHEGADGSICRLKGWRSSGCAFP